MQNEHLFSAQRKLRVGTTILVCKFNFKYIRRKEFYYSTDLSELQVLFRKFLCERYNIE